MIVFPFGNIRILDRVVGVKVGLQNLKSLQVPIFKAFERRTWRQPVKILNVPDMFGIPSALHPFILRNTKLNKTQTNDSHLFPQKGTPT